MTGAIVQARLKSTRLPEKVLLKVKGLTLIEILLARLKLSKKIDKIIVATSTSKVDKRIGLISKSMGVEVYYGSELDVLDRFYSAANEFNVETIVRITADCPLIDFVIVDKVIDLFEKKKADYASNVHPPSFPDGMDVEVFSKISLERAHKFAKLSSEREHVTPYIFKNPHKFKQFNLRNKKNLANIRLTVDNQSDFTLVKAVILNFMPKLDFVLSDILAFLDQNPKLLKLNATTIRNEGYLKSLKGDLEK